MANKTSLQSPSVWNVNLHIGSLSDDPLMAVSDELLMTLMTVWCLPDDVLMTAWWPPDDWPIVNFNCSFFQTSAMKILKYEQLKFTINVNNKKWLFHDQKNFSDVICTKIQFSMIFGRKNSVFANFFALKSVGRFWIWNMSNNRSKPS